MDDEDLEFWINPLSDKIWNFENAEREVERRIAQIEKQIKTLQRELEDVNCRMQNPDYDY